MPNEKDLPELLKSEYDILRILWEKGPQTVREVYSQLQNYYNWPYTTAKSTMDRMVAKHLLSRKDFHGIYLYTPLITRPIGLARLIQFFAERVLELDTGVIVSLFDQSEALTPQEIQELKQLLEA